MWTRALLIVLLFASTASGYTRLDLASRAERLLGQDTASTSKTFSDAEIEALVMDAARVIAMTEQCIVKETTVVILSDSTDYAMPSDFVAIRGIMRQTTGTFDVMGKGPLGVVFSESADAGKSAQQDKHGVNQWFDLGPFVKKMRLSPRPNASQADNEIRVSYYSTGNALDEDTSFCELPDVFALAVPDYVAWRAYSSVGGGRDYHTSFQLIIQIGRAWWEKWRDRASQPESEVTTP